MFASATIDEEKKELFEHMLLKANKEARRIITQFDTFNWKQIKKEILTHYAHLCNKNLITTQLENIRQNEKETLTEYSERARKLLRTKNAMYSHLTQEQREEHNRIAYKAYMKGLTDNKLKERVVTRGANTLDMAIENAIDMELDTQNQLKPNELYCRNCFTVGHRERDCRRKNNGGNAILNLVTAMRNVGTLDFNPRTYNPLMQNRQNRPNYINISSYRNNLNQNRPNMNSDRLTNNQYYQNRNNNMNTNRYNYADNNPQYGANYRQYGGNVPQYGGNAPQYGGNAPQYGGNIPQRGGNAPQYGGNIPQYGGNAQPYGGNAPRYVSNNPPARGNLPQYNQRPQQYNQARQMGPDNRNQSESNQQNRSNQINAAAINLRDHQQEN